MKRTNDSAGGPSPASDAPSPNRSEGESPSTMPALLADRVFAPFFFSNALSNTGNWFQNVAAGIVVYDLTGSNTAVGAVSILQFTATLLLTPFAGVITDRVNRRWMLFVGQLIALVGATGLAITVAVLGTDGLSGPAPIYIATAVIGLGAAIILPSLQAIVPALVRPGDLDNAVTLNSLTFNIARAIGPVLAGVVVGAFGAAVAFGINALTFLPLLIVLAVFRPRGEVEPDPDTEPGGVMDALRWVRSRPTVILLLAATLAVGWTSDPFSTLMPSLAESFGYGETVVGLLVGAFGLGAALTAPLSGKARDRIGRERMIPAGLLGAGTGLVVMALAPTIHLALLGALVSGSGFLLGVTSTNVELQKGIPDEYRGRVMALWSVAFLGCRPLAAAVDGAVADLAGTSVALGVAAFVALAAAPVFLHFAPTGDQIR